MPFLTDIDPQAAIKGSRDPLGIQTVWSRLGRHVVGNLTTVTTSVRDFTTTILGYYFVERVAAEGRGDGELATFLRWEQLAAHARFRVNQDDRLRGIERVRAAGKDSGLITLAADASGLILSNQRTYGLWGLYTSATRASGLVDGEPTRLTPAGRELVSDAYLPMFTGSGLKNADAVVEVLRPSSIRLDTGGTHKRLFKAVGRALAPALAEAEGEVYRDRLLFDRFENRTHGRQAALATVIEEDLDDEDWTLSPARVAHLAKRCRELGGAGEAAASRLDRIRTAELLLAPAATLFDLLLSSNGQSLADIEQTLANHWGDGLDTVEPDLVEELEPELRDSTGDQDVGRRWVELSRKLATGDYEAALRLLLDQNAFVMKMRGAGPWIELNGDVLQVKFREDEAGELPDRDELRALWRHPYFIESMRAIAVQLKG